MQSAIPSSRYEIGNLRLNVSVPNLHTTNHYSYCTSDQDNNYGFINQPRHHFLKPQLKLQEDSIDHFKEVATTHEDSTRKDEPAFSALEGLSSHLQ